jgi:hypothetical protein
MKIESKEEGTRKLALNILDEISDKGWTVVSLKYETKTKRALPAFVVSP